MAELRGAAGGVVPGLEVLAELVAPLIPALA